MAFEDDLRRHLVARTRDDVREMRAALARGELDAARRLAHRLLGAAGALGMDRLAGLGREIEEHALAGNAHAAAGAVERLATAMDEGNGGMAS